MLKIFRLSLTCEAAEDNAENGNEQKFVHPGVVCAPETDE